MAQQERMTDVYKKYGEVTYQGFDAPKQEIDPLKAYKRAVSKHQRWIETLHQAQNGEVIIEGLDNPISAEIRWARIRMNQIRKEAERKGIIAPYPKTEKQAKRGKLFEFEKYLPKSETKNLVKQAV